MKAASRTTRFCSRPSKFEAVTEPIRVLLVEDNDVFREALDLYTRTRGPDTPLAALVLNDIADVNCRQGNAALALETIGKALAITDAELDPSHPRVGLLLGTRALTLAVEGVRRLRQR